MALKKVSFERVKEEMHRGYDILSGGELRGGLAKIQATEYMRPSNEADKEKFFG